MYLGYFEIGRMVAWQSACSDFAPDFILAEAQVAYRSPALLGEPLAVEVTTSEIRTKAWVWSYRSWTSATTASSPTGPRRR